MLETTWIYTDIDSILDTRSSLLFRDFKPAFQDLLVGGYPARISDIPSDDTAEQWIEAWNNRDVDLLKMAKVTRIAGIIIEFVEMCLSRIGMDPDARQPGIVLNIWPYKLSDADAGFVIRGLMARMGVVVQHSVINKSPADLKPSWIESFGIEKMLMYDYTKWLDHIMRLKKPVGCPGVDLIAPAISFTESASEVRAKDAALKDLSKSLSVFKVGENMARLIVNLQLIDADQFSIYFGDP